MYGQGRGSSSLLIIIPLFLLRNCFKLLCSDVEHCRHLSLRFLRGSFTACCSHFNTDLRLGPRPGNQMVSFEVNKTNEKCVIRPNTSQVVEKVNLGNSPTCAFTYPGAGILLEMSGFFSSFSSTSKWTALALGGEGVAGAWVTGRWAGRLEFWWISRSFKWFNLARTA